MKKTGVTILIAFFTAWTITSFAQSEQKIEREVIIIKEKIDADGKKTIKKLIKRGYNITDEDIELMMDELDQEDELSILKERKNASEKIEIEIDSDTESDKEIQKILEEMDINDGDKNSSKDVEIKVIRKTENGQEVEKIVRRSNMYSEKPRLGIMIESSQNTNGVIIKEIIPNSPAASSELKADDVITRINEKPISTVNELMELLENQKEGNKLNIEFLRKNETMTTDVTLSNIKDSVIKKMIRKKIKEY